MFSLEEQKQDGRGGNEDERTSDRRARGVRVAVVDVGLEILRFAPKLRTRCRVRAAAGYI